MSDDGERSDSQTVNRLRAVANERFGVDYRALAAFRIALGIALLVDLGLRARNLTTFYTDTGALPRSVLAETYPIGARVSLHAVSGDPRAIAALFALAGVAAAVLAVGYRTRLAVAASLVCLASLQARNPFVLNAGDVLVLHLLGVGLLCPLGARWSVDAVRGAEGVTNHDSDNGDRFVGPASVLLLAVAIVVYVSNAIVKFRGTAWTSGEAVERVFRLTYLHGPLGGLVPEAHGCLDVLVTEGVPDRGVSARVGCWPPAVRSARSVGRRGARRGPGCDATPAGCRSTTTDSGEVRLDDRSRRAGWSPSRAGWSPSRAGCRRGPARGAPLLERDGARYRRDPGTGRHGERSH